MNVLNDYIAKYSKEHQENTIEKALYRDNYPNYSNSNP